MSDTIAAIATPPGLGGVAIIRISGPEAFHIATRITRKKPRIKIVSYASFYDQSEVQIDSGIVLSFKAPHSFTGEDVVEFQAHGGPVIMDLLLDACVRQGARLAEPGEFSKRAFLNNKIDLLQAEAIADLIEAQSITAARLAQSSLQGVFSKEINDLVEALIKFRTYIEAALDFPDEEIDFISDRKVSNQLSNLLTRLSNVLDEAKKGAILREGLDVVIVGKPNAGKSTLINQLSGEDTAIVTAIPGTTRDIVREKINIDGLVLHISDTAGLRESDDIVEKEGIKRAEKAIEKASLVLFVIDGSIENKVEEVINAFVKKYTHNIIAIVNKTDLMEKDVKKPLSDCIYISAKKRHGIKQLKALIKQKAGLDNTNEEGAYLARRRHLVQLEKAYSLVLTGEQQLTAHKAGELLAEDLRLAQQALSEITGEFTSDDLLGKIFSSFCIGK